MMNEFLINNITSILRYIILQPRQDVSLLLGILLTKCRKQRRYLGRPPLNVCSETDLALHTHHLGESSNYTTYIHRIVKSLACLVWLMRSPTHAQCTTHNARTVSTYTCVYIEYITLPILVLEYNLSYVTISAL